MYHHETTSMTKSCSKKLIAAIVAVRRAAHDSGSVPAFFAKNAGVVSYDGRGFQAPAAAINLDDARAAAAAEARRLRRTAICRRGLR
jgi:hypothetical protein